jgi:hypothetical protein
MESIVSWSSWRAAATPSTVLSRRNFRRMERQRRLLGDVDEGIGVTR